MRRCIRCDHEGPDEDFYRDARTRSGFTNVCVPCKLEDIRRAKERSRLWPALRLARTPWGPQVTYEPEELI